MAPGPPSPWISPIKKEGLLASRSGARERGALALFPHYIPSLSPSPSFSLSLSLSPSLSRCGEGEGGFLIIISRRRRRRRFSIRVKLT